MTGRMLPILLTLGILFATCALAQNDAGTADTGTPTQPGPQPAFTYPDATPSLDFLNQAIENSSITLGIGSGFAYTSYGYGGATHSPSGSWLYTVTPNVKIQQFRPKLSWNASFTPGFQWYDYPSSVHNSDSTLFSQRAIGGFIWQLSRHWQLKGDDSYIHTADPFASSIASPGTPSINNPSPIAYTPLTQITVNLATLALTDEITKVDTLAFTGTDNYRNTSAYNLVTSVPFYNLLSYGGRASYKHKLSPKLSLGVEYDFNSLDFGHGQQRAGIQTINFSGDYFFRPNMSLSGWIGPQYTSTKTVIFVPIFGELASYSNVWTTSLGVNYAWQLLRNSFNAGFIRQTTDGGGITATSTSNALNIGYRRMFTTKLNLTTGVQYHHIVSITDVGRNFDYTVVNAVLSYKITKSVSASAHYNFVHEIQSTALISNTLNYNDNVVGANINYEWNHPLGR